MGEILLRTVGVTINDDMTVCLTRVLKLRCRTSTKDVALLALMAAG